jgi:D-arabinose 1-dehydrogenase-like Zn-dependent alcohol dehydrogenase
MYALFCFLNFLFDPLFQLWQFAHMESFIRRFNIDWRTVGTGSAEYQIPYKSERPADSRSSLMPISNQNGRECLYEALDCIAKGKVKVMAEIVPLYNIADAYEKVPNGKVRFREVINA